MESTMPKIEPSECAEASEDSKFSDTLLEDKVALSKVCSSVQDLANTQVVVTAKTARKAFMEKYWHITSAGWYMERDLTPVSHWRCLLHPAKIVMEESTFWISAPNTVLQLGPGQVTMHMHTFQVHPSCTTIRRNGGDFILCELDGNPHAVPLKEYKLILLDAQTIMDLTRKLRMLGFNVE